MSVPSSGPPVSSARSYAAAASAPVRSSQRRATSRCISACSQSRERRLAASIVTMNFSPGPSGSGSETMSSTLTTPGSELKM